jgi:glutaredoxin-related protein
MTKSWGPCTWYLFHSLAQKITEEHFNSLKIELLNMIKQLCTSLPCPDCAGHASEYMRRLNINRIQSKQDLKMMLLSFHNEVNIRLNKPTFNETQLNEKYSRAKTGEVIKYFLQIWNIRNRNPKMMTNSLHKNLITTNFINWWNKNYIYFSP